MVLFLFLDEDGLAVGAGVEGLEDRGEDAEDGCLPECGGVGDVVDTASGIRTAGRQAQLLRKLKQDFIRLRGVGDDPPGQAGGGTDGDGRLFGACPQDRYR